MIACPVFDFAHRTPDKLLHQAHFSPNGFKITDTVIYLFITLGVRGNFVYDVEKLMKLYELCFTNVSGGRDGGGRGGGGRGGGGFGDRG